MFTETIIFLKNINLVLFEKISSFTQSFAWRWKTVFFCVCLTLCLNTPFYRSLLTNFDSWGWKWLVWQTQHPLSAFPQEAIQPYINTSHAYAGHASHLLKRNFRLTIPLFAYATGLGGWAILLLEHFAGFLFFFLVIKTIENYSLDKVAAVLAALAFVPTFIGSWAFHGFYFNDVFAYCCLLVALNSQYWVITFVALLLGNNTDERTLLASAMLIVFFQLQKFGYQGFNFYNLLQLDKRGWAVVGAALSSLGIKILLIFVLKIPLDTSQIATAEIFEANLVNYVPYGLVGVFKGYWLLIGFLFASLWANRHYFLLSLLSLNFIIILTVSLIVWDYDRSLGYSFPIIFIACHLLSQNSSKKPLRYGLVMALAIGISLTSPIHSCLRYLKYFVDF